MFLAKIALLVTPGSTIATRMPNGASSWASPSLSPSSAHFDVTYGGLGERGDAPGDRGDVDDRAAAPFAHAGQHLLQAADGAAEVHVHHVEVVRGGALLGDRVAADAGVVHEHVDHAAGGVEDGREPSLHRVVVGDVELDQFDRDPGIGSHRLQLGRLAEVCAPCRTRCAPGRRGGWRWRGRCRCWRR